MKSSYLILFILLQSQMGYSNPSMNEHDLSASCTTMDTIFAIDDGPQSSESKKTKLFYKPSSDFSKNFKQLTLPFKIKDPEGLACEGEDFFVVTGEYDQDKSDAFNLIHFKLVKSKKSDLEAELVSTHLTMNFIRDELVAFFGEDDLEEILQKKSKEGGLNIEGLALSQGILSFGLRSPLKNKMAIIFDYDLKTKMSSRRLIDLDKKGIRGLDFDRNSGKNLVISGPTDKEGGYDLWDIRGEAKFRVDSLKELCRPEAVVYLKGEKGIYVQSENSNEACEESITDYLFIPDVY